MNHICNNSVPIFVSIGSIIGRADIRGPSTSDSLMNKETDHLDIRTATINLVFVCLHLDRGPLSDSGPNPWVGNNLDIFSKRSADEKQQKNGQDIH